MIRAHITHNRTWTYRIYDTITRINLIRGVARSQPDAIDAANRLIRSLETSGQ